MSNSRQRRYDVRQQLEQLQAHSGDPATQGVFAVDLMHDGRDLEVVRAALRTLEDLEDPTHREALVEKFLWCEQQPTRRDGGGYIRAAILRAIRPVSGPDDLQMAQRAMTTYEMDGPFEICGELRTAGLLTANDIDPDIAAMFAARLLVDPQMTFSGEPTRTAVQVLASHGNLAPVFGLVSWQQGRPDVLAEGLRSLVELPDDLLDFVVDLYRETEDDQIMLGLTDLLLGHRTRDTWVDLFRTFFTDSTMPDLVGIIAMQIVASRSEVLIEMLREVAHMESDRRRRDEYLHALELA